MHLWNVAFAAVGLGLWQLGRLDHGPLGIALRGEIGTLFVGLSALGWLIYSLLLAVNAPGLRRVHRQHQAAPVWRKAATWLALTALTAGYGFGFAEQLRDPPATTAVPVSSSSYPASTRQHFMNACITSGGTQSICACAIDGIQAHYTLQDFVALDARAQAGEKMPAELAQIVSKCRTSVR